MISIWTNLVQKLSLVYVITVFIVITNILHASNQYSRFNYKEQGQWFDFVETDKARYSPGDTIYFNLVFQNLVEDKILYVSFRHLDQIVDEQIFTVSSAYNISWTWQAPIQDYKGYLVEIFLKSDEIILDHKNTAIDISSNWGKFPRYGFVSWYPYMNEQDIENIISHINRYHINGLQFYDWHHKHHMPLAGTPANPAPSWIDIANRRNYYSTVKGFIESAHARNMKTMGYNLLYGAWSNAHLNGVSPEWRLFEDSNHVLPKFLDFTDDWASDIYIMDPSNQQWKDYIISKEGDVFLALPFDGWHVDQLGDMGNLWNYNGEKVIVKNSFESFLEQTKNSLNVNLVMNAVNQYGQPEIAKSPVDFLYAEVWYPNDNFGDLVKIINNNQIYSSGALNTVLAAYINHDLAESPGIFNTPAVLLANAVIFAAGGAHIELGEHMLGHEYFPNSNLVMNEELRREIIHYYDFLVAYENCLRDDVVIANIGLGTTSSVILSSSPQLGTIWRFSKATDTRQIIHLINLINATTLDWRDNYGTQAEPDTIEDLSFMFQTNQDISRMWTASPDFYMGSPLEISFTQSDDQVTFTIPKLKYWVMVVIEYDSGTSSTEEKFGLLEGFSLEKNYPNPFNLRTVIPFIMQKPDNISVKVYDVLGRVITENQFYSKMGYNQWTFNGSNLSSGLYLYSMETTNQLETKMMVLMK